MSCSSGSVWQATEHKDQTLVLLVESWILDNAQPTRP